MCSGELPLDPGFEFTGHWLGFLNPYALLVGVTTLALFMMHGAIYLSMKTEGKLFLNVKRLLRNSIIFFVITFIVVTIYTLIDIPHLSDRFMKYPLLVRCSCPCLFKHSQCSEADH